ncbi:MAG: AI-2E family transporter [Pseudomonadota bacterium]
MASRGMKDMPKLELSHYFLFFLMAISLYLCFNMMESYIDPVILAVLLAAMTRPVHDFLTRKLKGKRTLAALCTCLILTLTIILPLILIATAVIQQGIGSFNAISKWISEGNLEKIHSLPYVSSVIALARPYLSVPPLNTVDFQGLMVNLSSKAGQMLVNQGGHIIGNLSSMAGKFFLMIFIYFFILRDFEVIKTGLLHLMPLSSNHEQILGNKIKTVARSALLGTLVTSAAQGLAGGIAFAICGLPGFFWGTVMAFASLIPVVGTALVWGPATLYLIIAGSYKLSIFMVVWSVLVVGMIDNIVRPLFMKGSAEMSTLFLFLAILGGINYFGLTGLLYGPLVFGITMVLFYIYELEFRGFLNTQDRK